MELVVAGLLNKQVGGKLGISEITVKAHRGQRTAWDGAAYSLLSGPTAVAAPEAAVQID
jgi:hypothetical protein